MTGASGWAPATGIAAPNAADEVITTNSLRVDLSKGDIEPPIENQWPAPWTVLLELLKATSTIVERHLGE